MANNETAGWAQKEGPLVDNSDCNLFSDISFSLFSGKHTTTYKYAFLKCLLDNLFLADSAFKISFADLNHTFASIYWNLIAVHHLPQMANNKTVRGSGVEVVVSDFIAKHPESDGVEFDSLADSFQQELVEAISKVFDKYVLGAFYQDTSGHLFGFSKKEKAVWLNSKSFGFLSTNKVLLDQVNYYEWLKAVEKALKASHSHYDNVSTVLEGITKRADLSFFKEELNELARKETCFYCGKHLVESAPLDHVIPWDFIKKDQLWNFVFACPTCNSSKGNKIPSNEYLKKLIERDDAAGIPHPDIMNIAYIAEINGIKRGWKTKKGDKNGK